MLQNHQKKDFIVTNWGILHTRNLNSLQLNAECSVYEVMRVIDGIALFIEDHFDRLKSSVQISGLQFEMKFSEFRQNIAELTQLNQIKNGNVKFVLSKIENEIQWSFSFIPHSYPSATDYLHGVTTGLLYAERENPNAKIIQNMIRERANQLIADQKLYEVLLVDQNGMITEGSRSNVFFVKGNRFYTAPASLVLAGVTRAKVVECLAELSFQLIEEAVSASEIASFDAVFLTGTSPNVLPVNCIGTQTFQTNNLFVEKLTTKYNFKIENYIRSQKK